jgi:hypothetical protein
MNRSTRNRIIAGIAALVVVVAAVVVTVVVTNNHPSHHAAPPPSTRPVGGAPPSALQQIAATDTVVTAPASELTATQITLLRQIAARTWAFLSGPDLDPVTHLSQNNVQMSGPPSPTVGTAAPKQPQVYTSPTEIGLYLTSIVAARDLGLISTPQANSYAATELAALQHLRTADGMFLRWYSTTTGGSIVGASGTPTNTQFLSSVDNAWMAQGLLVASRAFPGLPGFATLLSAMKWGVFYDPAKNAMYNSYTVGKGPSPDTYNLAYGGPRIGDYMAIGSGGVPGSLWYGLLRTPRSPLAQRQAPQGQVDNYINPQNHQQNFNVFEGSYVHDQIRFVPTFAGSMFQALAPAMVFPEQTLSPNALGLNDRNTALVQNAVGDDLGLPVWGWAPATTPERANGYAQYGAPALATKKGFIPNSAVTPYAAFLALPVAPKQAMADIMSLIQTYPNIYGPNGFADSVNTSTGQIASRYMAVSQAIILMGLDNALDNYKLTTYAGNSSYGARLAPYLQQEHFHIQGLG